MAKSVEEDVEDVPGQVLELPADAEAAAYHSSHPNHNHELEAASDSSTSNPQPSTASPHLHPQSANGNANGDQSAISRVRYDESINNSPSKSKFRSRLTSDDAATNDHPSPQLSINNDRLRRASQLSLAPSIRTAAGGAGSVHSRDGSARNNGQGSVRGNTKGSLRMKQKIVTTPGKLSIHSVRVSS